MIGQITAILFLFSSFPGWAENGSINQKPNIIILFADDLGYADLACYGNPLIRTPQIDQMAKDGVQLTSFYVAASICSPSRASLLTGRYPVRTEVTTAFNPKSKKGLPPGEITLAEVLSKEGYQNYCIGKWHLGHQPEFLPTNQGFHEFYGVPYSNDTDRPKGTANPYFEGPPLPLMHDQEIVEQPVDQALLTRKYTEKALEIIEEADNQPFFMYLSYTMPHVPLHASDRFGGISEAGLYGDVVEEIDWSVGEVLKKLEHNKLQENTLVIFTSDNGPFLNVGEARFNYPDPVQPWHHGTAGMLRDGKFSVYEGGFRMPCIVKYPAKIPPNRISSAMITSLDLFSTIIKLADGQIPEDRIIDGMDVLDCLAGRSPSPRELFLYYKGKRLQAARWKNWKLHLPNNQTDTVQYELYNLSTDVSERYNLINQQSAIADSIMILIDKNKSQFNEK